MKNIRRCLVVTLMGISLLACNLVAALAPDNAPEASTINAAETMSALLTPTSQLGAIPSAPCPIPGDSPPVPDLSDWTTIASELLRFLNSAGAVASLQEALASQQRLPQEGLSVIQIDITGDALEDVALSILSGDPDSMMPAGLLFVFICDQDAYALNTISPDLPDFGLPIIIAAQDMNGDGIADLLTRRDTCGAHTCFAQVELLMWNGATLENRLQGTTDDLPSPVIELHKTEANHAFEVRITATGINSAGAGPFRRFVRTWIWDQIESAFVLHSEMKLPSIFRIHVLHDADQAALQGDHGSALGLYNQVVEDEALDDWLAGGEGQQNLTAYAMFRRMVSHLLLDQIDEARQAFTILTEIYTDAPTGSTYAEMGRLFWSEFESTNDVTLACLAVQTFASQHETGILEPLYYGYANPVYTAREVCPFTP